MTKKLRINHMAVACEPGKRRGIIPLQFRLWSTEDPEYKGENA